MNDLISRQAAIDAICKAGCGSGYCGVSCDDVKAIEQLPSAEVEPVKHGTWINDNNQTKCSICGKPIPLRKVRLGGVVIWEDNSFVKYCPNCGARMNTEEGEDA